MTLIELLRSNPTLLLASCGLLGLVIGSFLNVVIARLPRMLETGWKSEARDILGLEPEPGEPSPITLLRPASHCPRCQAGIKPWHNVPLLGWLILRGRCARCTAPISAQYPLVELAAGALAGACAWQFGWSAQLAGGLILAWTLLTLAMIDWHTQLLPDNLTLPLLWLGLLFNLDGAFAPLPQAVVGAVAGYLLLWSVFQLFRLLTGKEGMGFGDFKLLAALGAWYGWPALPALILMSSAVGALVGIALMAFRRHGRDVPIAFGPYIAGAGLAMLFFRDLLLPALP